MSKGKVVEFFGHPKVSQKYFEELTNILQIRVPSLGEKMKRRNLLDHAMISLFVEVATEIKTPYAWLENQLVIVLLGKSTKTETIIVRPRRVYKEMVSKTNFIHYGIMTESILPIDFNDYEYVIFSTQAGQQKEKISLITSNILTRS